MQNADVSVIVLTRNSAQTIGRCLESVVKQEPGEIIAVDNMSTDATRMILDRYGVRVLVENVSSKGLSRQLGVTLSACPFVMFVDSDVELGDGCITKLRDDLEKHGWAGIHASLLSWENVTYWQRSEDEAIRIFFNLPGPTDQIGTIAVLYRRDVLLKYPFDPNMSTSCEDVDLCRRLAQNKQQVGVSSAIAYHYHRRQFSSFARQKFGYGLGNARLGLKYRSMRILVGPLLNTFSLVTRGLLTGRARLIPYWVTAGVVQFSGVLSGLSNEYMSSRTYSDGPRRARPNSCTFKSDSSL